MKMKIFLTRINNEKKGQLGFHLSVILLIHVETFYIHVAYVFSWANELKSDGVMINSESPFNCAKRKR